MLFRSLLTAAPPGAHPGWYLLLEPGERLVGKPFGASGLLLASTYRPRVDTAAGSGEAPACTRGGSSRRYTLRTTSGRALGTLAGDDRASGYVETPDLLGAPFIEAASTQNAATPGAGNTAPAPSPGSTAAAASCSEDPRLRGIAGELARGGPPGARYGGYFLRLGRRGSAGAVVYDACIPIAITESNWKEN